MGNCQAVDAAALVIQHPDGKIERYYGPVSVREVMKMYPGHYVSLIIPLPEKNIPANHNGDGGSGGGGGGGGGGDNNNNNTQRVVRFTRVKLLRPTETLALGHAYRLITSQEVMKVLRAKKYAKMKRHQSETSTAKAPEKKNLEESGNRRETEKIPQEVSEERQRQVLTYSGSSRSKTWRPSLQSISEATV